MNMSTMFNISPNGEELGRALHHELLRHDWSQPFNASVEEVGLAMASHIGNKRLRNEDRIAVARICAPGGEVHTIALVCDGVGGSDSGDQAAAFTISAILLGLSTQKHKSLLDAAKKLIRYADEVVRVELKGRGTTTVSMVLSSLSGGTVCANVGDSRVYGWVPGKELFQITTDDTVENELKGLPGDHRNLLNARGLKGRLSQAIGEADRSAEELRVQAYSADRLEAGALLGSDGLWRAARDFESVMLNAKNSIDAVRRGINLANWVGGLDNVSAIAIDSMEKFSRPQQEPFPSEAFTSVSLWIGANKFKFIADLRARWVGPAVKTERPKRQIPKPKKSTSRIEDSQLEILEDKAGLREARPMVEVTLGPEEDKQKN